MVIREMTLKDYPSVYDLWLKTDGIGLSDADSLKHIEAFLERNPHASFVAEEEGRLVGAVISGHDGRRGFIYHLAVEPGKRQMGTGKMLVNQCLESFSKAGIQKVHVMVFSHNLLGQDFWQHISWEKRTDIMVMSRSI